MLDATTKRKIDSARNILVGKVPDPKAQVEQVTTALVYKFMDDMDKEAQELGGKARFFTNGFEKFAWSNLLDPKLSGQGRLDLYVEAITHMSQNPHIPQLFRDIFKDSYLPYRDPQTLSLFLKEINDFTYDHSEKLGDAFEYLLSVLGSQGDAGQFRTPRHIIDFMVDVVSPKKDETILDPACGTAGFLISAYKHIIAQHDGKDDPGNKEVPLTPDEKKRLMNNIVGYDISPDMVRLSLVNMYLHGFPTPNISEYDTLTDEERWDDSYDVILANPPFMTPTGGIRPHRRFSIQANRSEVLFVDYIAEHLNPKGRGAVIIPEGIIFQAGNAYKALRKMLVENYLYAVVSLPAGVFNPYSGVKTSILFFDKALAKDAKEILFVKVQHDGFELGAQRRPHERNDLPMAIEAIQGYAKHLASNPDPRAVYSLPEVDTCPICLLVDKKEIEAKDYVLSIDRHGKEVEYNNSNFEFVKLGEIVDYEQPTNYIVESTKYDDSYKTPVLTAGKTFILGYTNETTGIYDGGLPVIIFDDFTTATKLVDFPFKVKSSAMKILKVNPEKADVQYIYYVMQKIDFTKNEHKRYWISEYSKKEIPLPSLEVQKQIVEEISGYQKIIAGAKQIINSYFPSVKVDPSWNKEKIPDLAEFFSDGNWIESKDQSDKGIRLLQTGNVGKGIYLDKTKNSRFISDDTFKRLKCTEIFPGDVLVSRLPDPVGRACLVPRMDTRMITAVDCTIIRFDEEKMLAKFFVCYTMTSDYYSQIEKYLTGSSRSRISRGNLSQVMVPVPPLDIQKKIIENIQEEEQGIEAATKLLRAFEEKVQDKIAEVWGE